VRLQLLNRAAAEGVTRRYHHLCTTMDIRTRMLFLIAFIS
jgi:hypothetical protein